MKANRRVVLIFAALSMVLLLLTSCSDRGSQALNDKIKKIENDVKLKVNSDNSLLLEKVIVAEYKGNEESKNNPGSMYSVDSIDGLSFIGYVENDNGATAYLSDTDKKLIEVKVGDVIREYKVESISSASVKLTLNNDKSKSTKVLNFKGSL